MGQGRASRRLVAALVLGGVGLLPSNVMPQVAPRGSLALSAPCGNWTVAPAPVPLTPTGELDGVTAVSPRNVWAVGSNQLGSTLVEHWNGRRWRIVPAPSPPESALLGISAVSAGDIWAVGYRGYRPDMGTYKPLIEHWSGSDWHTVRSPLG